MVRKGFVYTLEAVIAASLFLGLVLVVIPGLNQEFRDPQTVQRSVHSALESLDRTGKLQESLENHTLEERLADYVPANYNYSVRITRASTDTVTVSSPQSIFLEANSSSREAQVWIREASGMDITYLGETVVSGQSSPVYLLIPLSRDEGYLNFTGTGTAKVSVSTYMREDAVSKKNTRSVNYILGGDGFKNLQVMLWPR